MNEIINERFNYHVGPINDKAIADLTHWIFGQYLKDPIAPIVLALSSHGGQYSSTIRFSDFVKTLGINLITIGIGEISSAASILFLCGKRRYITEQTIMLCHNGSIVLDEDDGKRLTHEDLLSLSKDHTETVVRFNALFSRLSGIAIVKVNEFMDKDSTLDAQEIKDLGIAHAILPWSEGEPFDIGKLFA